MYTKYVYNHLQYYNYDMLFAANLHWTIENVGLISMLGCCYTIHCDGMEIHTSAAKLGWSGTQQDKVIVFSLPGSSLLDGHLCCTFHIIWVGWHSTKVSHSAVQNANHLVDTEIGHELLEVCTVLNCEASLMAPCGLLGIHLYY